MIIIDIIEKVVKTHSGISKNLKSKFEGDAIVRNEPRPSPGTTCTGTTRKEERPEGAIVLLVKEHSTVAIGKEDTLKYKKEEGICQTEKTAKGQLDGDATGKATDVTDSKLPESIRLKNDKLIDNASAECLEVNRKESRTDNATRNLKVNNKKTNDIEKADEKDPDKNFHKHTDMENVEMNEEGTIEKLQYHVDEIDENEGSKLPN